MALVMWQITGLHMTSVLAIYAISLLPTYLLEEKGLKYTHAAIVVNTLWGAISILPPLIQFVADSYLGNFRMAMLTATLYGSGLLVMSELINSNKNYWWLALPVLAIGVSGQQVISLNSLVRDEDLIQSTLGMCIRHFLFACIHIAGVVVIPHYVGEWSEKFSFVSGLMIAALFVFWFGSYKVVGADEESPITMVVRVIIAAVKKGNCNSALLHERGDTHSRIARSDRLRFLDKAAVVLENTSVEHHGKWNLCTVTEVEQAKRALLALPLCLVFLQSGIISNVGDTYFIQQAKSMHNRVRKIDLVIPLFFLPLVNQFMKFLSPLAYLKIARWFCTTRNIIWHRGKVAYFGILASTVFAASSTALALAMEKKRLGMIKNGSKSSVLELLPQYILLGASDGLSEKCLHLLFNNRSFPSINQYLIHFAMSCYGVGRMVSCLFSGSVSNTSINMIAAWKESPFKYDINEAHFDTYMWFMMGFCFANYFYCLILYSWAGLKWRVLQET